MNINFFNFKIRFYVNMNIVVDSTVFSYLIIIYCYSAVNMISLKTSLIKFTTNLGLCNTCIIYQFKF